MAFTVLQLHPFRGPRGDRLLLYFLIDGDGWEFVVFSFVASTWNYATFSAPDGRQALVGWQSYGVGVWTPYAGPLYERRRELNISNLEAVINGNCTATTENSLLTLHCGSESLRIPEAG